MNCVYTHKKIAGRSSTWPHPKEDEVLGAQLAENPSRLWLSETRRRYIQPHLHPDSQSQRYRALNKPKYLNTIRRIWQQPVCTTKTTLPPTDTYTDEVHIPTSRRVYHSRAPSTYVVQHRPNPDHSRQPPSQVLPSDVVEVKPKLIANAGTLNVIPVPCGDPDQFLKPKKRVLSASSNQHASGGQCDASRPVTVHGLPGIALPHRRPVTCRPRDSLHVQGFDGGPAVSSKRQGAVHKFAAYYIS